MNGAVFYDGETARRRSVALTFEEDALVIVEDGAEDSNVLGRWSYGGLRQRDAPDGALRLSADGAPELARLEIQDAAMIAGILQRMPKLARPLQTSARDKLRIVGWSVAAAASLIASAWFLVPRIADRLAPLVPPAAEIRLAQAADRQLRLIFGETACAAPAGVAALAKLTARLNGAADLPLPITVQVMQTADVNAVTLPGGRIYILRGLLPTLASVDELAGILGHEMGHVAHRDIMRKLLQTSGTSLLLGLLFGDVTGAGTLVAAGRTLLDRSYSRGVESAADQFAAQLMVALGRPPQPLGDWLWRGGQGDGPQQAPIFRIHPHPDERAAALRDIGMSHVGPPLLSDEEFRAIKAICVS